MTRLNLLVLSVRDIEASHGFYSHVFDLTFARQQHGSGPVHFACEWKSDGRGNAFVFELYPKRSVASGAQDAGEAESSRCNGANTRIGFAVQDVRDCVARARAYGVATLSPPRPSQWGLRAVIEDLDGHPVEITQDS